MPSSHNEPHMSLAPDPWHAAGRPVLTDGDEEPVDGVNALSRMAVSADWLGTCSSTPRQHQGWLVLPSPQLQCLFPRLPGSRPPAGRNQHGRGRIPKLVDGPRISSHRTAARQLRRQHKAPCQATLVPRTRYSWERGARQPVPCFCLSRTFSGGTVAAKYAISTASHTGRCLASRQAMDNYRIPPEMVPSGLLWGWQDLSPNTSTEDADNLQTRSTSSVPQNGTLGLMSCVVSKTCLELRHCS